MERRRNNGKGTRCTRRYSTEAAVRRSTPKDVGQLGTTDWESAYR